MSVLHIPTLASGGENVAVVCPNCQRPTTLRPGAIQTLSRNPPINTKEGAAVAGMIYGSCMSSNCRCLIVQVLYGDGKKFDASTPVETIYPPPRAAPTRPPAPEEVDDAGVCSDYRRACKLEPVDDGACALLLRRCLGHILLRQGYDKRDLSQQIVQAFEDPNLDRRPRLGLKDAFDIIRNVGAVAGHAKEDEGGTILDATPEEVDVMFDTVWEAFRFYWVEPKRQAALKAKLLAQGKFVERYQKKTEEGTGS